ncbi:PhoX family protein [Acinetobacter johnsonii]|uniref:PhoX family protein n=1 Tax=Acinetobacter johnsonii TaxID=40214 RepID=UPI00191A2C1C|nr:PhoX family phosphatase [Acinetobacter johnsonii]QQT59535.1 PhoX family phosphatase [Acinetobacter johnsonii]
MTEQMPFNDDYDSNNSGNAEFSELFNKKITRRDLITKTAGGAAALTLAASLTGCGDDDNNDSTPTTPEPSKESSLEFKAVNKNTLNEFTVPEGYEARVLYALGDPITSGLEEWDDSKIPTGASFTLRSGECHDGMTFFGMQNSTFNATTSDTGLLVMNHEYIDNPNILHPAGHTHGLGEDNIQLTTGLIPRVEDEALREINCHGVSVISVNKNPTTQSVNVDKSSNLNRRITAATPMDIRGPVKGNVLLQNRLSPEGTFSFGTINNCGNGYTPWGTYLATEENFNQYFSRDDAKQDANKKVALARYKIPANSSYKWHTAIASEASLSTDITKHGKVNLANAQDLYERWLVKATDGTAQQDFRHSDNTFGWIVEIDPFNGTERPVKRTALGRFAHEDCRASRAIKGQPLAFYMGDDSQGEYIYKFVSDTNWDPADINKGYTAGDKYMDHGKLYVAKFHFDEATQKATGEWIELNISNPIISGYSKYKFSDQADVLVNTRLAADAVGATKMDRPEWVAVNPHNGEVYVTLTNNSSRTAETTDAANPRSYIDQKAGKDQKGNVNGHIIRFREDADQVTASKFVWDIFLFGAQALNDAGQANPENLSKLNANNDFSSPDGMWFDPRGVLWIQSDDGAYTDQTNCMMLAALPGSIGDGKTETSTVGKKTPMGLSLDDKKLRRFLTGPSGCEITGVTMTPDYKAIFVNAQHPGGVWPSNHSNTVSGGKGTRPRSGTVVITRKDGGEIAGEGLIQAK